MENPRKLVFGRHCHVDELENHIGLFGPGQIVTLRQDTGLSRMCEGCIIVSHCATLTLYIMYIDIDRSCPGGFNS